MQNSFLDSLLEKVSKLTPDNMQTFIHKIAKQKEFLELIFNTIKEGIIVIDRNLNISYTNKSANEILGIPENSKKLKISSFLRTLDWSSILQKESAQWHKISRQEIEISYPSKKIINFYIVPNDDNESSATIILNDITEKRISETENIESEKLKLMSILAAGVAHEIGNPLNSLNLHLEILERNYSESLDDEAKNILKVAKSEVKRLDLIITQFLSAIRPTKPKMEKLDIREVIDYTLDFLKNELCEHHVKITKEYRGMIPLIIGDEDQLKQAFFNIIKNSMQAMPTGGLVNIKVYVDEEQEKLMVSIGDTGCGILPEDMPNIFEPYFTKKNDGTGLGLIIVDRIVREHGASFILESEPNHGVTFIIKFPLKLSKFKLLCSQKEELLEE